MSTAIAILLLHLDVGIYAQQSETVQSLLWKVPDGDLTDLSQTFTAGTTLPLSWNEYGVLGNVDIKRQLVYLWVTSFDNNPYSQLLRTNINMSQPGNFVWTIDIPDETLAISAKYVLRFKLPENEYNSVSGELSSPGFLVLRSTAATSSISSLRSSSTPTSSATTASSSSSTPTTTKSAEPSQTSAASNEPSNAMSTGAKAGIGIGSAVLALGGAAVLWFFFIRKRKEGKSEEVANINYGRNELVDNKNQQQQVYSPVAAVELPSKNGWDVAELPARLH